MAETLWSEAARVARVDSQRARSVLASARWLRRLAGRDGRPGLDALNRKLGDDAICLPGDLAAVAPDPAVAPILRSLVQAHLRHFDAAAADDGARVLFPGWSDFHVYARFGAIPIARALLAANNGDGAAQTAIDNLALATLLVGYAIDAPRIFALDRRVLIPLHWLTRSGANPADLAAASASPGLRGAYIAIARRAQELLAASRPGLRHLPAGDQRRLALALHSLTATLARRLSRRSNHTAGLGPTAFDRWRCGLAL